MLLFLISSIAGSILGNATDSWFAETKMGKWVYRKIDDVASWASRKLGLKVLNNETNWKKKYPNVSLKIDNLEARIETLEKEKSNKGEK
jgi:hypothetical protein